MAIKVKVFTRGSDESLEKAFNDWCMKVDKDQPGTRTDIIECKPASSDQTVSIFVFYKETKAKRNSKTGLIWNKIAA